MISQKVLTRKKSGGAARYYMDGAEGYYATDKSESAWQGKGAAVMGLNGPVDPVKFAALLRGEVAGLQLRKTTRRDSDQRIGIDMTFAPPKSVSMQGLPGGDARIIAAHDRAVSASLLVVEAAAQARTKTAGKSSVETTGNLVIAKFRHETSRELDPQIHTHAVVLNFTMRSDGQWRALHNDEIVKAKRYHDAVYMSELAREIQTLGYELRHEKNGSFELAHITRKQIEAFSKRTAQIEAELATQGLTTETASAARSNAATMKTRAKKKHVSREELFERWMSIAKEVGVNFGPKANTAPEKAFEHLPAAANADRSVRFAIAKLTERESVIERKILFETALKHGNGQLRMADVAQAIHRATESASLVAGAPLYVTPAVRDCEPRTAAQWAESIGRADAEQYVQAAIVRGTLTPVDPRYTTTKALRRETNILTVETTGRGAVEPITTEARATQALGKTKLNDEQQAAAVMIATTTNRVVGIQGFAGVGKSHMLKSSVDVIKNSGYNVIALAPQTNQVRELAKMGVKAKTVASFLMSENKTLDAKTVLIIDEAGVVPTRNMEAALHIAQSAGARVVLLGDKAQTKAIEAGRPFHQLQDAGMQTAHVTKILRQQEPGLKLAVEMLAHGRGSEALPHLNVVEIADRDERHRAIAADYVNTPQSERQNSIVVSPTNAARISINDMIRTGLGVAGTGREYTTLKTRDMTHAERRHARYYEVGDMIQPERDYANGLKRGEMYTIVEQGAKNELIVQAANGTRIVYKPYRSPWVSVYEAKTSELAVGDSVRVTRNDKTQHVANGDRFTVLKVGADAVDITDGTRIVTLPTDRPLHIDHAYVTTVKGSQGMNESNVIFDADTKTKAMDAAVSYVAFSRAKFKAKGYTDSMTHLPEAMNRQTPKHAALDMKRS